MQNGKSYLGDNRRQQLRHKNNVTEKKERAQK
jgi:hypothetical protein